MEEVVDAGEGENAARLSGLLAMLALPLVRSTDDGRMKRRVIEVEVGPDRWVQVMGAAVELGRLTIWTGSNGTREQYRFDARACPRWRSDRPEPRYLVEHFERARST